MRILKKEYTLYLDEILPLQNLKYFCLAGVIIEGDHYQKEIVPAINKIKRDIFEDENIILHESNIRRPQAGTDYMKVKKPAARNLYFTKINEFFTQKEFVVLGAALHGSNAESIYPNHRDRYFVCLQIILENFTHFLMKNDATGKILIESRNPKQDEQLRKHFNNLRFTTGTLFYNPKDISRYIKSIDFPSKQENNIGLQIADMIPNPMNRQLSGMSQVVPDLINVITSKIYDGNVNNARRFGMKILVKDVA